MKLKPSGRRPIAPPTIALAQSTTYPLIIQNGDNTLVFEHAPERAVTLNGHATELMLSLGLAPKMVGTAYLNHPILDALKADYDRIPILSTAPARPRSKSCSAPRPISPSAASAPSATPPSPRSKSSRSSASTPMP